MTGEPIAAAPIPGPQVFDLRTVGRQLLGPLQVRGGFFQPVLAQMDQTTVRPARRFLGNPLDCLAQPGQGKVVIGCVQRRDADLEVLDIRLIQGAVRAGQLGLRLLPPEEVRSHARAGDGEDEQNEQRGAGP